MQAIDYNAQIILQERNIFYITSLVVMGMGWNIIICITIGVPCLLDIIWHMDCLKEVQDCTGAFAADLLRLSQSCG